MANCRATPLTVSFASRFDEILVSLCDGFIVAYGLWTIAWWANYSVGGSFDQALLLGVPALVVAALTIRARGRPAAAREAQIAPRELLPFLFMIAIAIGLSLFMHRPDPDDEIYLAQAVSLIAYPGTAIATIPGFEVGTEYARYAVSSYVGLSALLTRVSGASLLSAYYMIVPTFMAAMTIIISARLLRLLVGKDWLLGLAFLLIVFCVWGDAHRTHANFGLVRLYQGKAVLVSVIVPAIFYFGLRYLHRTGARYDLALLVMALVSGMGATPTGLAVGPMLVGLLSIAAFIAGERNKTPRILAIAVLVSAPVGIALWMGYGDFNPGVHTAWGVVEWTTNREMYAFTFGPEVRGFFLAIAASLGFLVVTDGELRAIYRNFIVLFVCLLAFPWTSALLAKSTYATLSWRWLWIAPIPLMASVTIAGIAGRIDRRFGPSLALLGYFLLALWITTLSPRRVLSHENDTRVDWPSAKLSTDQLYLRPFDLVARIRDGRLHIVGHPSAY